MEFDVSLISRVSDEIKESAQKLRETANTPNEVMNEVQKIESSLHSLKTLSQGKSTGGTTQDAPDQTQG